METQMTKQNHLETLIVISLIILGVSLRIIPHPDNFAPVAAIAIFGGTLLPRRLAVAAPLGAMAISDAIIGFHSLIVVTWSCYALMALTSYLWLKRRGILRVAVMTLSGSLFFFVVTNLAVWIVSGMYSHNFSGLVRCFVLALPFFRNTLLSDAVYTSSLFGLYFLAMWLGERWKPILTPKQTQS